MSEGIHLSVVTSTHKPRRDYLERVIQSLRGQSLPVGRWEYVLVDNGGPDAVTGSVDLSWHPRARLVHEPTLGLTHGRLKGIDESTAPVIVFVDDDNVLSSDYLAESVRIAERLPFLGAWGGSAHGEFERPVPGWIGPVLRMLAIRTVHRDCWSNMPFLADSMPTGAGLSVRRAVAERYRDLHRDGLRPILLDRVGESLASAGDEDLAACACDIGLAVGVFHTLALTHLIPSARLEERYILRLAEEIAWSTEIRRGYHDTPSPAAQRGWPSMIANALRMLTVDKHTRALRRAEDRGRRRGRLDFASLRTRGPAQA